MKVLTVHVKPRASRDEVEKKSEFEYIVHVKALPQKGKANKDALKILARFLGVSQSQLALTKGEKLQTKTVLLMD